MRRKIRGIAPFKTDQRRRELRIGTLAGEGRGLPLPAKQMKYELARLVEKLLMLI